MDTTHTLQCPGEMFIILRDDVPEDSVIIEFITENEWIRIEPDFWNQKVRFIKALGKSWY